MGSIKKFFVNLSIIINFEFNGTRFHLDSRFYTESAVDPFNRTYEEVHIEAGNH